MAPRSRNTTDDQAGQAARADESAAVSVIDEPTQAPEAEEAPAAEQQAPRSAPDLPDPAGRPPLIEVSEAAARGAFPNLED